jgi:hypothetical protein
MQLNNYQHLRETIKNWNKFPSCIPTPRSPIINKGYPGTFNLSFGEGPMMNEYGGYQSFDHDFCYSTIQVVIRPNDIFECLIGSPNRYLGVFEMADIHGQINLKEKINLAKVEREQTLSLVSLLNSLGIESSRIYPKYCAGGC